MVEGWSLDDCNGKAAMVMKPIIIVRKPVGIGCSETAVRVVGSIPPAKGGGKCGGTMLRFTLSRIEEGLGHEGFECTRCHRRVKYVPPGPVEYRQRVVSS